MSVAFYHGWGEYSIEGLGAKLADVFIMEHVVAANQLAIVHASTPNTRTFEVVIEITMDFPGKVLYRSASGHDEGGVQFRLPARRFGINADDAQPFKDGPLELFQVVAGGG